MLAVLAVCALIVVWVVMVLGAEARRAEQARNGPPRPQPYSIRRALRSATLIVAITGGVLTLIFAAS